jgi:hypothetical protein
MAKRKPRVATDPLSSLRAEAQLLANTSRRPWWLLLRPNCNPELCYASPIYATGSTVERFDPQAAAIVES